MSDGQCCPCGKKKGSCESATSSSTSTSKSGGIQNGKGDAPRHNIKKYAESWENIFGKKSKSALAS